MTKNNKYDKVEQCEKNNPILEFAVGGCVTFASSLFCMWLCQFSCGISLGEITTISAFIIFISIYAIVFAAITVISGRVLLGNAFAMTFLFIVTVLDFQIYSFRGTEILPGDIRAIRTALGVAGQYHLQINVNLIIAATMLILYIVVLIKLSKFRKVFFWRGISLAVLIGSIISFNLVIDNIPLIAFGNEGMKQNSFPVNFCRLIYGSTIDEPDGYSIEEIKELEETYSMKQEIKNRPIIIAIMNESFADLNVVGNLDTSEDVMPFYNSLQENTVKGMVQVPMFGAGTANTEWEFLTGNSMHFLPSDSTPYSNNALTDSYTSIVSNMKTMGYYCIAMHPYHGYMYTRNTVYPRLGFDEVSFLEDYPQEKIMREYVSDCEMYEEIIHNYETHTDDSPLFIFGITMQNHGGYEYEGENYEKTVELQNMSQDYPKAEQFLSLMKESNAALEYLISYFKNVDKDVVIAFFGDHQPTIEQEFYEELAGDKASEQLQFDMHTTPFFIWANYDIEEKTEEITSANYLSNYIYEVARLPKPGFNLFLEQLQDKIPVLSNYKVFCRSMGEYVDYNDLPAEEARLMQQYNYLVYNAVYDV